MSENLGRLTATRKLGSEPFISSGDLLPFTLLHFWQWLGSDLVGNTFRGALAEYLVAQALAIADSTRAEWGACDLCTAEGIKVEVKSAAYLQSWSQRARSPISFGIRPTRAWDPDTDIMVSEARRQAAVYVFALLAHGDKQTLNPFVDTTRPACPHHPNHPLEYSDGFWCCPRNSIRITKLGELPTRPNIRG